MNESTNAVRAVTNAVTATNAPPWFKPLPPMEVPLEMLILCAVLLFAVYLFYTHCLKRICEKCGTRPGMLIWIPILNFFPLLQAAQLPVIMFVLLIFPLTSPFAGIWLNIKLCHARGKGLAGTLLVVFLPMFGLPYLAFSK